MNLCYAILVVGGVGLFLTELLVRRRRHLPVDRREMSVSVRVGALAYASAGLGQIAVVGAVSWPASHIVPWHLPLASPLVWVGYILLDDFTGYWVHRAEHRFRFLWSAHLVHHSANDLTMANAARLSPVEGFYQPLVNLWAPLLGFPFAMYAPLTVVSLLLLEFQHTRVIGHLGRLDRWLNTPSNHRVHHGTNRAYLDRNFGGWTMIWDRLFGTYVPETEPVVYGVTDVIDTDHVLTAAAGGYPALVHDLRRRHSLRVALDRPGRSALA